MPLSPPTCPRSTVQNRKPFWPADEQRLSLLISGRQMPERPHLQSGSPSLGLLWEFTWSPYTHPLTKHLTLAAKGSAMRHQIAPHPAPWLWAAFTPLCSIPNWVLCSGCQIQNGFQKHPAPQMLVQMAACRFGNPRALTGSWAEWQAWDQTSHFAPLATAQLLELVSHSFPSKCPLLHRSPTTITLIDAEQMERENLAITEASCPQTPAPLQEKRKWWSMQVDVQHVSTLCESSPEDGTVEKKRGWHFSCRLSSRAKVSQLSLLTLREAETQEVKGEKLLECFLSKCSWHVSFWQVEEELALQSRCENKNALGTGSWNSQVAFQF